MVCGNQSCRNPKSKLGWKRQAVPLYRESEQIFWISIFLLRLKNKEGNLKERKREMEQRNEDVPGPVRHALPDLESRLRTLPILKASWMVLLAPGSPRHERETSAKEGPLKHRRLSEHWHSHLPYPQGRILYYSSLWKLRSPIYKIFRYQSLNDSQERGHVPTMTPHQ